MSYVIKIKEYELVGEHIEYIIEVTHKESGDSWRFRRRYSHLRDLHKQLKSFDNRVPEFPPKKIFGSKNPRFLAQRKSELEDYFNEVAKLGKLLESQPGKEFFKPKDANITKSSPVQNVPTYKKPKQGPEMQNFVNQLNEVVSSKFFDLSAQPSPPDEDDVKRQARAFESLIKNLRVSLKENLPEGSHINQPYFSTTLVRQKWVRHAFKETKKGLNDVEVQQHLLISFK
jgi:hypothetical protein